MEKSVLAYVCANSDAFRALIADPEPLDAVLEAARSVNVEALDAAANLLHTALLRAGDVRGVDGEDSVRTPLSPVGLGQSRQADVMCHCPEGCARESGNLSLVTLNCLRA